MPVFVMIHDDDCGQFLTHVGACPKHGFNPDMQSTAFVSVDRRMLKQRTRHGETFLGTKGTQITNTEAVARAEEVA
jgi:hypothetical protein